MQSARLSQQTPLLSDSIIEIESADFATLITYPRISLDNAEYKRRINELESLGIKSIHLGGRKKIGRQSIVGKGCVSIVVKAKYKEQLCALKIRRLDSGRENMSREVEFHKIANTAGIGPKLVANSENFILMELVEGLDIINWISQDNFIHSDNNEINSERLRDIIGEILEQCYRLDRIHLDHGELSCIDHHVIVEDVRDSVTIIDYESSSTVRKTSNVTSAAQSLFLSGYISNIVQSMIKLPGRDKIINYLKTYKWNQNRENFDNLISGIIES